jgi:hypothetical protein
MKVISMDNCGLRFSEVRRLGAMLTLLIALAESDSVIPEESSARVVWAVIGVVILGLYFFMRSSRKNAAEEYWARRKADEERIANDPDMRRD